MGEIASQITSLTIVYSTVYSGADQRKHQSSASLAFVGNPPVTDEFPAQMASNAKNVSIWWRHYVPTNFDNDIKIVSDIGARARYIQFSKMTKKLYFNWCNIGVKHQLALYIRTPKMSQFQHYSIYRCESWQWAECTLIIWLGYWVQVFSLILDSWVGLSAGILSAGDSVPETLGSNPAFNRGGQLVSFRLTLGKIEIQSGNHCMIMRLEIV